MDKYIFLAFLLFSIVFCSNYAFNLLCMEELDGIKPSAFCQYKTKTYMFLISKNMLLEITLLKNSIKQLTQTNKTTIVKKEGLLPITGKNGQI